ncbi:MAG: ExeM/NucH family extracellular endonuclease [Cyanobacteria bacterium P01_D01_bin.116]
MALNAGDIAFVQYNADGTDNFAFVALVDIAVGEQINFTDNGWQSSGSFRANEGVITWTATAAVTAGTVLTIDNTPSASAGTVSASGSLNFSGSGDQVIAYQGTDTMIAALNNEGAATWQADATSSSTSALPQGLINGTNAVALTETDNVVYNGPTTGDKATLLAALNDASNWSGSNSANQTFSGSFTVNSSTTTAGVTITESSGSTDVTEGGATDTYDVVLDTQPTDTVTVTITTGGETTTDFATLTFDATNWDTPQTVTVSAVDDSAVEGNHSGSITHTVSSNDTDYNGIVAASITVNITDNDSAPTPITKIHEIQGSGTNNLQNGNTVTIEGIVVGDFQGVSGDAQLRGFFVQEETADEDGDPTTSEGIYIFDGLNPTTNVNVGDLVRVTAVVEERNTFANPDGLTSLNVDSGGTVQVITPAGTPGLSTILPTQVTLPETTNGELERYEGMLVEIVNPMTVSQNFFLGRYGQLTLSSPDDNGTPGRLFKPTNQFAAGTPQANALTDENARRILILDDGLDENPFGDNPNPVPYLPSDSDADVNDIRPGSTVTNLIGVLDEGRINSAPPFAPADINSDYRLHPTQAPVFNNTDNPRPATPDPVGGSLTVGSFNVLNYFNGDGQGGGFPTARGADTPSEFERQSDKIVQAIAQLDADVLGLMELENDGFGSESAIQELVDRVNAVVGAGTYDFINPGTSQVGTDAIAVGFIYKPAVVTPVGAAATLETGAFDQSLSSGRSRVPLAQTFQEISSGGKFTAVVNHFKSKRPPNSPLGDGNDDQGDGQGAFNQRRTEAANDLADWLATDPTNSGDADFLILGDLNAYAEEDPILALENKGYTNLIEQNIGSETYSFIFDGEAGYLDHVLGNASLTSQVTGAAEWHINTDEPQVINYDEDFNPSGYYTANVYRSSDHDPVLIGLNLTASAPDVEITATDNAAAEAGGDTATFTVTRTGDTTNALTVEYTISGTATNGTDYSNLPTSVVIPAGQSSVDITVTPIDDSDVESPETVILTLDDTADYDLGTSTSDTATITSDDVAPGTPVVEITATDNTAAEVGGDTATFTVTRTGDTTNALTVEYAISGTATNGSDYNNLPTSVVIPAGQSSIDVTVTPIDDADVESPETVVLTLNDTADYDLGTNSTAEATITSDDAAPVVQALISEFQPNPTGADPNPTTFELSGTPGDTFTGVIISIESDGVGSQGTVDRVASVSGTFDVNGLLTVSIPDLENPSFTVALVSDFTGDTSTDIDTDNDGVADDLSTFGTVFDAIGVPDNVGDQAFLYGSDLGGTDFTYTGDEPRLIFRDASVGDLYAINDPDGGQVFDISGTDVTPGVFNTDPTVGTDTFGAINPTVANVNTAPTATDDSDTTLSDTPITFAPADLLGNDNDPDGDTISISNIDANSAQGGTIALNADGTYTYTPATGFIGNDSFTYEISDGNGGTATATVNIRVNTSTPALGDIVINEWSQGTAGGKEWVEFLVTGNPGESVDIQNHILSDTNRGMARLNLTGSGFANIPVGTYVVIYNSQDVDDQLEINQTSNPGTLFTPDFDFSDGNLYIPSQTGGTGASGDFTIDSSVSATAGANGWGSGNSGAFGNTSAGDVPVLIKRYNPDAAGITSGTETSYDYLSADTSTPNPTIDDARATYYGVLPNNATADGTPNNPGQPAGGQDNLHYLGTSFDSASITNDANWARDTNVTAAGDSRTPGEQNAQVLITTDGNFTVDEDGTLVETYQIRLRSQPTANVTVTITPNGGTGASDHISLNDGAVDQPITLTFTPSDWYEDQTVTIEAGPNAADGDDEVVEGAHSINISHTVTSANTNSLYHDPTNSRNLFRIGEDPLTESASPASNLATNADFTVNVVDNDIDVEITATDASGSETGPDAVTFQVTRTGDTTNDLTVEYTIAGTATNGTDYGNLVNTVVIPAGQTSVDITVTPIDDADVEPTETVELTLVDGTDYNLGANTVATADIADNDVANTAPVATNDSVSTNEDTAISNTVLTNDSDPEGDTLTVTEVNGVAADVGNQITLASGALLTLNQDGTYSYNPNGQFESLNNGDTANDSFTYTISDGNGGTDIATVNITIDGVTDAPVNTAPVAQNDSVSTNEDTAISNTVLTNDSDPEGDTLTVTEVNGVAADVGNQITLASGALLTLNQDGTYSYNPNGQFESLNNGDTANDSFTYTISDGNGGTDIATVNITIDGVTDAPVNTAPVAQNDSDSTQSDTPLAIAQATLLANDTDPDGDVLSITSFDAASTQGGTVSDNGNGTFTYTPAAGFVGSDTFDYTISDGNGGTDTATVSIQVDPIISAVINGTRGRDNLIGTNINETITGGVGRDNITTGSGNDTIVYTSVRDRGDIVTDFTVGSDVIDISALLDSVVPGGYKGTDAIADGYVSIGTYQGKTAVFFDADGFGGNDAKPYICFDNLTEAELNQASNFQF